ncbi:hypothetical protein GGE07_001054 [Sinorhizobium terangae]|nr:hypothetical protein [Sinorhizobium terangae]
MCGGPSQVYVPRKCTPVSGDDMHETKDLKRVASRRLNATRFSWGRKMGRALVFNLARCNAEGHPATGR